MNSNTGTGIEWQTYLPIVTVFISGLFGLLVVRVTASAAHLKSKSEVEYEKKQKNYDRTREIYVEALKKTEIIIRSVRTQEKLGDFMSQPAHVSANIQLSGQKEVIEQFELVGDLISSWSSLYLRGAPKKSPGSDFVTISSTDSPFQEKAKKVYTELEPEMTRLVLAMRAHLEQIEP